MCAASIKLAHGDSRFNNCQKPIRQCGLSVSNLGYANLHYIDFINQGVLVCN